MSALMAVSAVVGLNTPAFAAVDAYLKIEGVKGDSTAHKDWIDLTSWQWGATRGQAGGSLREAIVAANTPNVHQVTITKAIDVASLWFKQCVAKGCHAPTAQLMMRKAGGEQTRYVVYMFNDVMVSHYAVGGGGDRPSETVTLKFASLKLQYEPTGGEKAKPSMPPSGQAAGAGTASTASNPGLPPPGPH
jgi:type VI secretion system secreted protein Hcp